MDTPTRTPKARAIFFDVLPELWPPRIMKNRAAPRLARMAKKAMVTRYVMNRIIW
jgi:hypothetical protein